MTTLSNDSFWKSDDKIPISQKSVSVPSQNGLEYGGGQRVVIEIPSTVDYIQPKESYLKFDVKLKLPASTTTDFYPTYLQLDEILGGQSLIKDVRIYSGGAGKILLEEIQDYNVLTNVKYSYETNDVLRAKRALTEGSTCHSVKTRATMGTSESHKNNVADNPCFKQKGFGASDILDDDSFQTVKCLLPLHTGLFSSNKVLPVLLTEGLVIDIILEDATRVMRQLDTARRLTRFKSKPVFHSVNGSFTGPNKITAGVAVTEFFLTNDNSIKGNNDVPFGIGESLGFAKLDDGTQDNIADTFIVSGIETNASGLVKISCSDTGGKTGADVDPSAFNVYSTSVEGFASSYSGVSYTVSNVEMILQQLDMPKGYTQKMMSMMKEGGSMNYDFLSFTNFKYSQLSSDVVANIRLPLNMSRAKAILSIPTDATTYSANERISGTATNEWFNVAGTPDRQETSDKSGLVGISDFLQDYQFFYDGKLNPSRKVNCRKTSSQISISQQPIIELEKALVMSGITPFSFRSFQENFVLGRALSLHNGVYDTRGKDFNLQVEYTGQGDETSQKNKLWMNYVSHLRRIEFKGDGISLMV